MRDKLTRAEILGLLKMSEVDGASWLRDHEIIGPRCLGKEWTVDESLADLAYRLRDKAVKKDSESLYNEIHRVYADVHGRPGGSGVEFWWMLHSRSIHVIVAALLVLEAKE